VRRLGEHADSVHRVGALGLDEVFRAVRSRKASSNGRRAMEQALEQEPFALVVQHPVGASARQEYRWMRQTLQAVSACRLAGVVIYPCSDPGHTGVLRAIEQPPRGRWLPVRSLPRAEYLEVLQRAAVIVGNSSSGIIEAATAGTPAVNIGPRQNGRQRSGRSVIDCGYGATPVQRAIREALRRRPRAGQPCAYGDGHAAGRIVAVLASMSLNAKQRHKTICY
jgi:UDP-N-acetylglucosamine 2-epimerase